MRSLAPVALVLLVAPLAFALPGAGVTLVADVEAGDLRVRLTSTEALDATLVVVRDDPILGPVLDRAIPVALDGGAEATLDLDGLRAGGDFSLKLLPAGTDLPLFANSSIVVDAARLLALPDLANVTAPAVAPLEGGQTHRFASYPVGEERYACGCFLATSPEGTVVVGWLGVDEDHTAASFATIATSFDGGRNFSAPLVLNTNRTAGTTGFAGASHGGQLHFLFDQSMPTGTPGVGAWSSTRLVRVDARSGAVAEAVEIPPGVVASNLRGLAVRPDGAVLFATTGHTLVEDEARTAVKVDAFLANGDHRHLADLALPAGARFAAYQHILSNAAGALAVVYVDFGGGPTFVQRSADGGSTWTPARTLDALDARGLDRRIVSAAMDATGTLHLAAIIGRTQEWTNTSEGNFSREETTLSYARVPIVGEPTVVDVAGGATPSALVPEGDEIQSAHIEAHGARVWLLWSASEHFGPYSALGLPATGIESTTNGATFGPAYRLEGEDGAMMSSLVDLALMPDGRPILLAWMPQTGAGIRLSVVPLFDPLAPTLPTFLPRTVMEPAPPVSSTPSPTPAAAEAAPTPSAAATTPASPTTTPPATAAAPTTPAGADETPAAVFDPAPGARAEEARIRAVADPRDGARVEVPGSTPAILVLALATVAIVAARRR